MDWREEKKKNPYEGRSQWQQQLFLFTKGKVNPTKLEAEDGFPDQEHDREPPVRTGSRRRRRQGRGGHPLRSRQGSRDDAGGVRGVPEAAGGGEVSRKGSEKVAGQPVAGA